MVGDGIRAGEVEAGGKIVHLRTRVDFIGVYRRGVPAAEVVPDFVRHRVPLRDCSHRADVERIVRQFGNRFAVEHPADAGQTVCRTCVHQSRCDVGAAFFARRRDRAPGPGAVRHVVESLFNVGARSRNGCNADKAKKKIVVEPSVGKGGVHALDGHRREIRDSALFGRILRRLCVVCDHYVYEGFAGRLPRLQSSGTQAAGSVSLLGFRQHKPIASARPALRLYFMHRHARCRGNDLVYLLFEIVLHFNRQPIGRLQDNGVLDALVAFRLRQERIPS